MSKNIWCNENYTYLYVSLKNTIMLLKEEIKELRLAKNLSREKLAHLSGTTSQTIYRAENSTKITLENYIKIIKALNDYDNTNNTPIS